MWAHGLRQSTVDNVQGMEVAGGLHLATEVRSDNECV